MLAVASTVTAIPLHSRANTLVNPNAVIGTTCDDPNVYVIHSEDSIDASANIL